MDAIDLPLKSVSVPRRKKIQGRTVYNCGVELTSEGSFQEKKILNTPKNVFMSTLDLFKKAVNELIIDNDEEVYERLLQLQDVIQAKLLAFKCANEGRHESEYDRLSIKNLSSSKSLASSTLSLASVQSASVQSLVGNKAYKKFLSKVNCPFCFKAEENKIKLIQHLDKNCEPLKKNEFEEKNFIPFSAFQILPNNTLKCNVCRNTVLKNLKHFFIHVQNKNHQSEYAKAAKIKNYTEFLFCSCCKILVPNNYTQIDFHINHKTHKSRSDLAPHNLESLKNFDCVYLKNKKFKCLICPSRYICNNVKDILDHFENKNHGKKNGMFHSAFCEVCMKNLQFFEILSHLNSHDHIQKEKSAVLQDLYETCYYCGFVCSNLKELSVHMTAQCKEVSKIREQNLTAEKLHKNAIKSESKEQKSENSVSKNIMPTKGEIKRENTKEDLHLIVKDNTDVLEVYRYFKKFGEITRVEIYKEKNVLIQFRDKSAAEDALLLRDVIHINGVKMEITTDEVLTKPTNAIKKVEKEIDSDEERLLETSDEIQSDDSESANELGPAVPNTKLEDLFQRVSHHLSNSTKIFDSSLEEKILEDCAKSLGRNRKYSVIGFAGTRLSFPVEMVDLYCDVREECNAIQSEKFYFPENLIRKFYIALCESSKWQVVNSSWDLTFPSFKCTHVATRKSCRLIFTPSAKLLTDMLSYCIEQLDVAKNFCMIVRFWFTVHKLKLGQLDFAVISLLIFFLVTNYVTGNVFEICNTPNTVVLLSDKLNEYTEIKQLRRGLNSKLPGKLNVVAMFLEFLAFLCKFNFRKTMILLPLDFEVPRKIMYNKEFDGFFKSCDVNKLRDSAMCVMDPLLSVNLTRDISQDDLELLLQAARNTLKNTG